MTTQNTISGKCTNNETAYAIINTTDYNNDGVWNIIVAPLENLKENGFSEDEVKDISKLKINESRIFIDGQSDVRVVRLA